MSVVSNILAFVLQCGKSHRWNITGAFEREDIGEQERRIILQFPKHSIRKATSKRIEIQGKVIKVWSFRLTVSKKGHFTSQFCIVSLFETQNSCNNYCFNLHLWLVGSCSCRWMGGHPKCHRRSPRLHANPTEPFSSDRQWRLFIFECVYI